eukprot:evm.model.scf_339EXC.2 EVM.evm.TU.scf_339EXC.2   scf_339EXC:9977-10322(+)
MSKPSRWPQGGPPKQQGVRSSPLAVDIALLLSSPAQALLPVLGLLEGWHEVPAALLNHHRGVYGSRVGMAQEPHPPSAPAMG